MSDEDTDALTPDEIAGEIDDEVAFVTSMRTGDTTYAQAAILRNQNRLARMILASNRKGD